MNMEDYSQFALSSDEIGDDAGYLVDGMSLTIAFHKDRPIGLELPTSVEMEVTYAEPGVKGDRVSGATKDVIVETGISIKTPLFVGQGDRIRVDTRTGAYLTRV